MRKRFEYYKGDWQRFSITLANPYEPEYDEKPYNTLNIAFFGHSFWFKVPEFVKAKTKWIDTSNAHWNKDKPKPCGYTEVIRKMYGFTFTEDAIHVYYGIQPGSWSRDDPENSDHTKLFWYPWNLEIVRHDLLYPNGDVYHRNLYPKKKNEKHIHWWEVFDWPRKEDQERVEVQFAEFVELDHWTKDGKNQKARIRLTGEEREWRPKWTRWLPFFKYTKRVVDCNSDTELGSRAGSWKGGMMGWSVPWEKDESMKQAFWKWYKTWDGN